MRTLVVRVEDRVDRLCAVEGPRSWPVERAVVAWDDEPIRDHPLWPPRTAVVGPLAEAWAREVYRSALGHGDLWDAVEWMAGAVDILFGECRLAVPDQPMRRRRGASVVEHAGPLPMPEPAMRELDLRIALSGEAAPRSLGWRGERAY